MQERKSTSLRESTGRLTEVALGYQRMLSENPRHPEALVGITLVALASRQTDAAVTMAKAAVASAPKMGAAWVALGQALKSAGQTIDAEKAYMRAIHLDGMEALARMGLGGTEAGRRTRARVDTRVPNGAYAAAVFGGRSTGPGKRMGLPGQEH